jgi:hypothetical protein
MEKIRYRFKVTTADVPPRILFVYGRDPADARSKVTDLITSIESAGTVEKGVVHFPPEELREVMATMQDGRRAPGA